MGGGFDRSLFTIARWDTQNDSRANTLGVSATARRLRDGRRIRARRLCGYVHEFAETIAHLFHFCRSKKERDSNSTAGRLPCLAIAATWTDRPVTRTRTHSAVPPRTQRSGAPCPDESRLYHRGETGSRVVSVSDEDPQAPRRSLGTIAI
jgi:hypothetical protein